LEKKPPAQDLIANLSSLGIDWNFEKFGRNGAFSGADRLRRIRKLIAGTQVVHGRSDVATTAALIGNKETPVLWDVRSLWSDQRLQIGSYGWNKFTARGARILENICAERAVAMTTLSAAVVPILQKRHRKLPEIQEVIPTCVDLSRFSPSALPRNPYVALLSGTFNNYYDLDKTAIVINSLRKHMKLKVIWAKPEESSQLKLGVGEDEILTVNYRDMPNLIKKSHFGIAICKNENKESLSAAVPTKIGEFLACGRPVLVNSGVGDLDNWFIDNQCGVIIQPNSSPEQYSKNLLNLLNDSETVSRCRDLAEKKLSLENSIDHYCKVYEKMISLSFASRAKGR
jgi:glycosyltransferase involved in cell wall biosynthesis